MHKHVAVVGQNGRRTAGFVASRAALEHIVFGKEGINDAELIKKGVSLEIWKRISIELLLEANKEIPKETFELWGKRLIQFAEEQLGRIIEKNSDATASVRIALPRGKIKTKLRKDYLSASLTNLAAGNNVPVQTVHAAKGQTHDLTVFVCPVSKQEKCPSVVWWSTNDADKEERRIAFVAATRTSGDLLICVSEASYARFCVDRPDFVKVFECMSVAKFIESINSSTSNVSTAQRSTGRADASKYPLD